MHVMETKALEFASKLVSDQQFNQQIDNYVDAAETTRTTSVDTLFSLIRIYGYKGLFEQPRPGSEYKKGSNEPYDKIEITLPSGKTETKYFWNIVADALPKGKTFCEELRKIGEKEGDYEGMDDPSRDAKKKEYQTKRNDVRKAVKKCVNLFFRIYDINQLGKDVECQFLWLNKPGKASEPWTGELENKLIPISVYGREQNAENPDQWDRVKWKKFGADQLLSIDMEKVRQRIKDGKDSYTALVMREKKSDGGNVVELPDLSIKVSGQYASKMVAWLVKSDTKALISKAMNSKDETTRSVLTDLDDLRRELNDISGLAAVAKKIRDADADKPDAEQDVA